MSNDHVQKGATKGSRMSRWIDELGGVEVKLSFEGHTVESIKNILKKPLVPVNNLITY